MIDEHFAAFVSWLKAQNMTAAIEQVEEALKLQGRTIELKRMKARLAG